MVKQRLVIGLVFLTATFVAASCDSGDTVVAVNVSYDSTAMDVQMAVSSLQIVIKPKSGAASPSTTTVQIMRDDGGAITTPVYKRIAVSGWSGQVDVTVDARDGGGSTLLSASTTAELSEHHAVAAFVQFSRAAPDGGTDAAGTGGQGSGGETGTGGSGSAGSGPGGSG